MPELPEVQSTIDALRHAGLPGEVIAAVEVGWPRTVGGDVDTFCGAVVGRSVCEIGRRGKFIVLCLTLAPRAATTEPASPGTANFVRSPDDSPGPERGWMLCHLRMSGRLHLVAADEPREGYERVVLHFASGRELRFVDPRKFGRLLCVSDPEAALSHLGLEPLDDSFTPRKLHQALGGRRRAIKPTLLDQGVIAGLGNIYVDEALFAARIHPLRRADSLSPDDIVALHTAIQQVLRLGLSNLGVSLGYGKSNFRLPNGASGDNREALQVFRRTGLPCPVCGHPVERLIVAQRSTHLCPRCQPA